MHLYLVHHGEAVGPEIDPSRPLTEAGLEAVQRLARAAAARGVKPAVVWHSGKLRAKQTARAFWRECNALAEFSATRDLQPDDRPEWMRDRLLGETRDILVAGHFPHLPRLRSLLLGDAAAAAFPAYGMVDAAFPAHAMVALSSDDGGVTWKEDWKLNP